MPRSCGMYTLIVSGLLVVRSIGAGPASAPPDPIDLVEESVVAVTTGPDVIVGDLYQIAPNPGIYYNSGGISAFAVGTISCNIGNIWLNWFDDTDQHPVIGQSMYRLKNDRFEHIGQSWLKHGFYALSQELCHTDCIPVADGNHLGVHCSDPYQASLNAQQSNLGPKYQVNAHTGVFTWPKANPPYSGPIARRLQVRNSDLDPSLDGGGLYFVEGQYVTPDDAAAGNQNNNASYRRVAVNGSGSNWTLTLTGTTQREQPAIRAWKDTDPTAVTETDTQVQDDGLFILSAKVTDLGTGCFHYEYALQNLNSDRSGASFAIPLPVGVTLNNIGFHDVDYHDGDGLGGVNWDGTDWPATVEVGKITWYTTPYDANPNANALRWGTLYNFRFDANIGPDATTVTLGLFKPGPPESPTQVTIQTTGPRLDGVGLTNCDLIDCNLNEIPDDCDIDCGGTGCSAYPECGLIPDCAINTNGDGNGIPDDCELELHDCQPIDIPGHGIPDACDIFSGLSNDCQPNGIPDECEPDCDDDGIPNSCEPFEDTDGDGVLDCVDLCRETTPVNACLPPYNQYVICCFSNNVYTNLLTWSQCLNAEGIPVCDNPPVCPGTPCRDSLCRDGCLLGDFDSDGDLDLFDVGALQSCFSASVGNPAYVAPSAECLLRFDFDGDGDVDQGDYNAFLDYSATYPGP